MRTTFFIGIIYSFILGCNPDTSNTEIKQTEALETKPTSDRNERLLRHVVLIKFKESTSQEEIAQVEEAFGGLQEKIKEIKDYEWGTNNSPEGINKGFTHCFLVTFENEEGREIYLPHPDHKEFVDVLSPHMEDVLVVDYWTE